MVHIWLYHLKDDTTFHDNDLIDKLENAWFELDAIIAEEIVEEN